MLIKNLWPKQHARRAPKNKFFGCKKMLVVVKQLSLLVAILVCACSIGRTARAPKRHRSLTTKGEWYGMSSVIFTDQVAMFGICFNRAYARKSIRHA